MSCNEERETGLPLVGETKRSMTPSNNFLYKCVKCFFKTNYLSRFKLHAVKHGNMFYKCGFCHFETNRIELYLPHKATHIGQKKYYCSKCSFKTCKSSAILQHKCMVIKCSKCPFVSNSLIKVKLHFFFHLERKSVPDDKKDRKIPPVTERNMSYFNREAKNKSKSQLENSTCELNRDGTPSNEPAVSNIKNGPPCFKCLTCNFEAKSKGSLRLHNLLHKKNTNFRCSQCDFVTDFQNLLDVHEKCHLQGTGDDDDGRGGSSSHLNEKQNGPLVLTKLNQTPKKRGRKPKLKGKATETSYRFICSSCNLDLPDEDRYLDHLKVHEPLKTLDSQEKCKYQCPKCSYETNMILLYKKHARITHGKAESESTTTRPEDKTKVPEKESQCVDTSQNGSLYLSSKTRRSRKRQSSDYENLHRDRQKYSTWSIEEKVEIMWCHLLAKQTTLGRKFSHSRRRLLEERGVINHEKLKDISDQRLQGVIAMMRMGKSALSIKEIRRMEKDVIESIRLKLARRRKIYLI